MIGCSSSHIVSPVRVSLQSDGGGDVAGAHFVDFLALVGVHLQQTAHALALVLARVVDVRARLENARVHAEERQLTDERIGRNLERQSRERRVVFYFARFLVRVVVRRVAFDRGHFDRRRQVVDDCVEQCLNSLVLE